MLNLHCSKSRKNFGAFLRQKCKSNFYYLKIFLHVLRVTKLFLSRNEGKKEIIQARERYIDERGKEELIAREVRIEN